MAGTPFGARTPVDRCLAGPVTRSCTTSHRLRTRRLQRMATLGCAATAGGRCLRTFRAGGGLGEPQLTRRVARMRPRPDLSVLAGRLGAAWRIAHPPFGPWHRAGGRRVGGGVSHRVRGSAGPVVRNSVRDNPAQRQVFVGDSRQTSPQRGNAVPLRCYNSMSRCPSGGRGRWGGGGVRGRQRGWRCGRRGVGRR